MSGISKGENLARETTMKDIKRGELGVPKIVDRSMFQAELDALRVREKAHTHEGDAIAAARRRLPMVEVDGSAPLDWPERGAATLLEAFEGRRQLIAYYFMWHAGHPAPEQCEGCTWVTVACPRAVLYSFSRCHLRRRSARARTKRASGTATSWAGRCPGTRPRTHSTPSWLDAGWAGFTSFATCDRDPMSSRLTGPTGRGAEVMDNSYRLTRFDRIRTTGDMGGLADRLAATV